MDDILYNPTSQYSKIKMDRAINALHELNVNECKAIASWLSERIKSFDIDEALYQINFQKLKLSNRTRKLLKTSGINSVKKLLQMAADWDNFRMIKGIGDITLKEIKHVIEELQQKSRLDLTTELCTNTQR